MADRKPDLSTEEVRQGDRHHTNSRVLVIGLVVVVIAFAIAFIYNQSVTPDTATSLEPGTAVENVPEAAVEPEGVETTAPGTPEAADPTAGELDVAPAQ